MAVTMVDFWQIVDVFDSVDGTMFTAWDYSAQARRTLHTEKLVKSFEIGDLVHYSVVAGKVKIRPVPKGFAVPRGVKLLMPTREYHRHPDIPAGGIVMDGGNFDGKNIRHA